MKKLEPPTRALVALTANAPLAGDREALPAMPA